METRLGESTARLDARLVPAFEAIESDAIRALSVDVFDTLLFRKVAEPVDAFPLIGAHLGERGALAPGITPAVFARVRRAAEHRARERRLDAGEGQEATLAEIHTELPPSLFARPVEPAELEEVECAVESALLVPDLDVVQLVRAAQDRGLQLVAVSDTYFSEPQLRLFIARGALAPVRFDRVFASSHHRAGKGSGLFSVVLEELGCRPQELLHVGDNHEADVAAPQRLGIRTVYFERRSPGLARILERERVQLPEGAPAPPRDGGLTALRGKVLHQTEGARQPAGLRPFWDYGAASLGPAFTGFAEWVQEQATRAGTSRVFCLMREGELLTQLVNAAGPPGGQAGGVVAEPFWLSRQVCARASVLEGSVEELRRLVARRDTPTLRELCGTLGLSLADLPGLAEHGDRRIADHGLGDEVIDLVAFDPDLRERVVAGSHALRRRVLRYIERHRPPGESRLALVDLGWGATIQATVEALLREGNLDCTTVGLYLLTHHVALDRALDGVEIHGYLGEFGVPEGPVAAIRRSPEILEQVCMPDSGSQVDLTEELQPLLADGEPQPLQSVERAAVQQGVLAFQRAWLRYRAEVPDTLGSLTGDLRQRLLAMVARAVVAPTADEAALFAGWLHDENFGSQRVESITAGPAVRALRYLDPQALTKIPMTELYWPYGLAALQDEHLASSVAAASGGLLPWEAFSSSLELGDFEVQGDLGWGFSALPESTPAPRRNRRGLSYARATLRGDFVQRVRVRPASHPCVLRIDWVRLRCRVHREPAPVTIDLREPSDFRRLRVSGARWVAPQLLLVSRERPRLDFDLRRLVDGRVYEVVVEFAFAGFPIARSRSGERFTRARSALRRLAKETWIGAPVRLAGRVLRRTR